MGPFLDEITFELGQGPKDMEDEFPAGGGRIDLLGEAFEADSPPLQLGDDSDQDA